MELPSLRYAHNALHEEATCGYRLLGLCSPLKRADLHLPLLHRARTKRLLVRRIRY